MSAPTAPEVATAAPEAAAPAAPEAAMTWTDIATSLSLLAMDLMDAREQADAEKDPIKKAAIEADIERMENEYAEMFVTYEATPYVPEEDDRYTEEERAALADGTEGDWGLDYENGQGCADW